MAEKKKLKAKKKQTKKSTRRAPTQLPVDGLPCVVFRQSLKAKKWLVSDLSSEFTSITAYPISDYIGEPVSFFRSLIHADDVESINLKVEQSIASNEAYEAEYRIKKIDGSDCWLYESARPELNRTGKVIHMNGIILDISDRKQGETFRKKVETDLIKHQNLHRQAEKMGQLGYWEWDEVEERLVSCSEQICLIYGLSEEEILSEFTSLEGELNWIHADDRELYRNSVLEADERLEGVDLEFRVLTKAGGSRYVREISELVLDEKGERFRSFGTMQDITEQKQAEARLHFQIDLQRIVGEISTYFSVHSELDTSISESLQALGDMTGSARVSLWNISTDRSSTSKTHEWCAEGLPSQFEMFQNIPLSTIEGLGVFEQIESGRPFYIPDIYELPPARHKIRKFFDEIGIHSIVVLPIMDEGQVIWFFTLNNPMRLNKLVSPDISMLKIFGDSLFAAIQRGQAQTDLLVAKEAAEQAADIVNETLINSGQSVVMVDAEGKILVYHDIFLDDINITQEEASKFKTFEEAIRVRYPDDEKGFQRSMALARSEKQLTFEINTSTGRIIEARHNPLEGGGFVRVYTDISELKKTQNDLVLAKEMAERSSNIANKTLHNIGQSILMVDGKGELVVYNDVFLDDIDVTEEQAANIKTFEEVIRLRYPDDEEAIKRSMELARSGKKAVYEAVTPSGRVIEIRQIPLEDGGFVRTYSDISELKKTQNDLLVAKEIAEGANQAKANFLATMSHEIRTPMTGVIGMVDLLKQTNLGSEQRHMVQTIAESGETLLTVINDILDFSKIEAGKLQIENIPFSLLDLVESSAQAVATSATNRDLRLIVYVDPGIPQFVMGDPVRIRQILTNLASNAIKFSDSGEVVLRAEQLGESNKGAVNICLSVTDQGIGIAEEAQENLFQSFFQAEASTSRKFGGSGLGLAISRRLCELMDAQISVESILREGSTFKVEKAFAICEQEEGVDKVIVLDGLRLLLLTSNSTEEFVYRKYLQHWQADVDICSDADSCVNLCASALEKDSPYDIVILGPQWNREQQSELRKRITTDKRLSETKFVCLLKGRRRRARADKSDIASVDVDPLRRNTFLAVVAIAAGKASPEVFYKEIDDGLLSPLAAPSVDEAREMGSLILVAEDSRINRDVIGQQLDLLGYAYEIVDDGREALDAWFKNDYGLLLTDCHMPNLDGFELATAIRKHEKNTTARIPIVAITANTLLGEAERCLSVGMDDYLAKPVVMKDLKLTLDKWMPIEFNPDEKTHTHSKTSGQNESEAPGQFGQEPIDKEALRGMLGDDQDMIKEMLQDFVEPLQQSLLEIQGSCKIQDADSLFMAAHKLKSSALVIGATELASIGHDLETAGKEEDWGTVEEQMIKLLKSMTETKTYIENL